MANPRPLTPLEMTPAPVPAPPDAPALDKSGRAIRDMFAGVASRYDLLNHLLSAGFDILWRRRAAAALASLAGLDLAEGAEGAEGAGGAGGAGGTRGAGEVHGSPGAPVLDLCCGTGDQALSLRRLGARVAAADFCLPMLTRARRKFHRRAPRSHQARQPRQLRQAPPRPSALAADALELPFPDASFAGATVSFGLRNVADLDAALRQLARVLRPGGQLVVLEFAVPVPAPLRAIYLFYFRRLLPWIGRLVSSRGAAYRYLPSSVLAFPQREGFTARMTEAGFAAATWRDLSTGIVCLYSGRKAA